MKYIPIMHNFKCFCKKQTNSDEINISTFLFCGIPLYSLEWTNNTRIQHILGNFICTVKVKTDKTQNKIIKFLNIPVYRVNLENDIYRYYLIGVHIYKIHIAGLVYKKYLKRLKFKYDHVYILNSNSGESSLFLAYLAKAYIRKNNSENPLFVATKKYHTDILKMYLPKTKYIYVKNLKFNTQNTVLESNGHKFYIEFSDKHFNNIEKSVKEQSTGSVHYFDCMLKTLDLKQEDISKPKPVKDSTVYEEYRKKFYAMKLREDNFVILAPEAFTLRELSHEFWSSLAKEIKKRNIDIYLNITDKGHYIEDCKTSELSYAELYCLAENAKAVISLRSGLSEFLLPTGIPNIAIYTEFRNHSTNTFSIDKGIAGFSMLKIPFVNKKNIKELNVNKFKSEKALLSEILFELEKFGVKECSL